MYSQAYFDQINHEEAPQAERLADYILHQAGFPVPKSVIDIGCATGLYLAPLLAQGIDVRGFEYSESAARTEATQIPKQLIKVGDLTKPKLRLARADLVICLEVLEHIDHEDGPTCVDNICDTGKTVIFSAAIPGQGGDGHINCQPKAYWQQLFYERGFVVDTLETAKLVEFMLGGYHMGWFTNNVMVLRQLA